MATTRDERWQAVQEIRARNADRTAEEVERDVAEEIEAMRAERHERETAARGS